MKMGWCCDGDGLDALRDQFVETGKGAAASHVGRARPMRRQRIDDPDQRDIGQAGQHPGMVAAHHASADHAHAKRAFRPGLHARCGPFGTHLKKTPAKQRGNTPVRAEALLACHQRCGEYLGINLKHVLIQRITPAATRWSRRTTSALTAKIDSSVAGGRDVRQVDASWSRKFPRWRYRVRCARQYTRRLAHKIHW